MAGSVSEEKVSRSPAVATTPAFVSTPGAMPTGVNPWCRAIAWGAMLAGSLLPTILSRSAGEEGYSVPVAQVLVLVVASVIVGRSSRLRVLSGFLLTIAVVRLGWSVIAPILADWAPVHGFMDDLDWGPKMFVTRLLNVAGALLMLTTFIGRRITRADLFSARRRPERASQAGVDSVVSQSVTMVAPRAADRADFRAGDDRIFVFQSSAEFLAADPALAAVPVGCSHCRPQCRQRGISIPLRSFGASSQRAATW